MSARSASARRSRSGRSRSPLCGPCTTLTATGPGASRSSRSVTCSRRATGRSTSPAIRTCSPEMSEFGPVDLAVLPVWGWGSSVGAGQLDPERAARALEMLSTPPRRADSLGDLLPDRNAPTAAGAAHRAAARIRTTGRPGRCPRSRSGFSNPAPRQSWTVDRQHGGIRRSVGAAADDLAQFSGGFEPPPARVLGTDGAPPIRSWKRRMRRSCRSFRFVASASFSLPSR